MSPAFFVILLFMAGSENRPEYHTYDCADYVCVETLRAAGRESPGLYSFQVYRSEEACIAVVTKVVCPWRPIIAELYQ